MLVTLVATLTLVGAGQYLLVADRVLDELVHEHAQIHESDARTIERAFAEAEGTERPLDEVTEVLSAIAARPLIEDAVVADARGRVIAASDPRNLGAHEREPEVRESARISFSAFRTST